MKGAEFNKNEEWAMLYATYNILYTNDLACNLIKDLQDDMATQDKETRKIFGALLKRANEYFTKVNKIVGSRIDYLADYCGEMDDVSDPLIENFRNSLSEAYSSANIKNYDFFARVETMRSMCELAKYSAEHVIQKMSETIPRAKWLNFYVISEISKIANNLTHWMYRKIPKDIIIDFNESSDVMVKFRELNTGLMEFNNFDAAYRKAIEYEQERNSKK